MYSQVERSSFYLCAQAIVCDVAIAAVASPNGARRSVGAFLHSIVMQGSVCFVFILLRWIVLFSARPEIDDSCKR